MTILDTANALLKKEEDKPSRDEAEEAPMYNWVTLHVLSVAPSSALCVTASDSLVICGDARGEVHFWNVCVYVN